MTSFSEIIWRTILVIFMTPFFIIHGQSGEILAPIQIPIPKAVESRKSNSKSDFSVNVNADTYKLVFVTKFDGKKLTVGEEEAERGRHSRLKNFTEQLNKAGEQGYRILSVTTGWNLIAIVKLDEAQYEYDWFETKSSVHFAKSEVQEKLEASSSKGFRVVDHFLLSSYCEFIPPLDIPPLLEKCEYLDLFLLGKEKGVNKPTEQVLINSFPGWGAKPSIELEKQISEKLAEGFYPVNVFSAFEILLERAKEKNELLSDKPDVQVVRTSWGKGNLEDKVNELAKQGYRLAMTNYRIAVMYRNKETAQIPVSYVWLKADKKNFEKELAKLQEKGATYRTTYPNDKGTENTLIFEQKLKDDRKRSEFKVLKFEFDSKENQAEKKVYIDLTPASKEAVKTMDKLVKEGFEVRDLFYADGVSAILERR